jgi:hypothetical protein
VFSLLIFRLVMQVGGSLVDKDACLLPTAQVYPALRAAIKLLASDIACMQAAELMALCAVLSASRTPSTNYQSPLLQSVALEVIASFEDYSPSIHCSILVLLTGDSLGSTSV